MSTSVERELRSLGYDREEAQGVIATYGERQARRVLLARAMRVEPSVDSLRAYLPTLGIVGRFLTEHGESFEIGDYARSRFEIGSMGRCFVNTYEAVRHDRNRSTYIEGYVISGLGVPMHHALVLDNASGIAYDPTWRWSDREKLHRPASSAFIGVRVPLEALRAHWRTCGGASFIDDYAHDCPALRVPLSLWRVVMPDKLAAIREEHCMQEVRRGRAVLHSDGTIVHKDARHGA